MNDAVPVRPTLVRRAAPVIGSVLLISALAAPAAVAQRVSATSTVGVKLENETVIVRSLEGGAVSGTLMSVPGPDGVAKKQLGPTTYGPITMEVGIGARPALEWVAASWETGRSTARSGSVLFGDVNYKVTDGYDFTNATILETTVPALEGSSKATGELTIKFAPSLLRATGATGQDLRADAGLAKQKMWLTSNFRFELPGLPDKRVARIESFTVSHGGPGASAGTPSRGVAGGRDVRSGAPGSIDFPNLLLDISMADLKGWRDWHEDFVVKGNNGDAQEKAGAIVFLSPDMKTELARISLSNCGIMSLAMPAASATAEKISTFRVELYCERMKLALPPA
jgi:hypothetical protein